MFKLLVVEDKTNMRTLFATFLRKNQYTVFEASNGIEALNIIDTQHIDLIISDIMMPEMDGNELLKELRDCNYDTPILMITAKDSLEEKLDAFSLGADDYMVKPINLDEMLVRVKAILRRSNITNDQKLTIGDIILDYSSLSILKNSEVLITLKPKEFYILYKLLSYPNKIFTRQDLMDEFWGYETESDPRTVDTHVKRIRENTKNITEFEIITIRGLGYKGVIKNNNNE